MSVVEAIIAIKKLSAVELALGIIALILSFLIFMTVIGNIFPQTVQSIGLDWLYIPYKGVYADCARPENRGKGFCAPKEERDIKRMNSIYRSDRIPNKSKGSELPFTLHGN